MLILNCPQDSLVSSQVYEIIRTIYTTTNDASSENRVKVLQNTLSQLRLNNIATIDALVTHFTRLIELTSADDAYVTALAQTLAPCILRPRVENNLTMEERHSYRLLRDLFKHKEEIFGELKRRSGSTGSTSGGPRPRAISTDESNRRANMEARNKAIADRSRATSPAPNFRHRRDRSTGGSGESTRFPINISSPPGTERKPVRHSLDVPGSVESTPTTDEPTKNSLSRTSDTPNGHDDAQTTVERVNTPPAESDSPVAATTNVEKSNSLSRSSGRYSHITGGIHRHGSSGSVGSVRSITGGSGIPAVEPENNPPKPVGVTLEDKPIDD